MLVMAVRLLAPLLILRYPLFGGVICIVLDYIDFDLIRWFTPEYLDSYQLIDKWLDLYYLLFELYIVTLWKDLIFKKIVSGLFIFRLVGILLFEITQNDKLLFFFPNLFEVMFLYYLTYKLITKKDILVLKGRWLTIFSLVLVWKIYHEYYLHILKVDNWIDHTYNFLLSNL